MLSFDIVEPDDGAMYTQKYKLKIMTRINFPGVPHVCSGVKDRRLHEPPLNICLSLRGDFSTDYNGCSAVSQNSWSTWSPLGNTS